MPYNPSWLGLRAFRNWFFPVSCRDSLRSARKINAERIRSGRSTLVQLENRICPNLLWSPIAPALNPLNGDDIPAAFAPASQNEVLPLSAVNQPDPIVAWSDQHRAVAPAAL